MLTLKNHRNRVHLIQPTSSKPAFRRGLSEIKATMLLAIPLIIGQISQMLLNVADTVMIGKVGVTELAALTFANTLFYIPFVFSIGLLISVSISTANARGSQDHAAGRGSCRYGLYMGLGLGLILFLGALALTPFLSVFKQPEAVTNRTPTFFLLIMASLIPALGAMALKNHVDSLNRPWPSFWIFLTGVLINIGLNYLLIFGKLGFPELGLEGAGIATLISRFLILIGMIVWMKSSSPIREWIPQRWITGINIPTFKGLVHLGTPSSIQLLTEVSAFSIAGLLIGRFGEIALGAHQIALTSAGVAFMIPVGICLAMTVRIGEAKGANKPQDFLPIAWSGWIITAGFMILSSSVFFFLSTQIANAYVDETEIISLATKLLFIVGAFQVFDGIQVCSSGVLRGLGDVRSTAWLGLLSYICVGIPTGSILAFLIWDKPEGIWWGLFLALVVAAVTLTARVFQQVKQA